MLHIAAGTLSISAGLLAFGPGTHAFDSQLRRVDHLNAVGFLGKTFLRTGAIVRGASSNTKSEIVLAYQGDFWTVS